MASIPPIHSSFARSTLSVGLAALFFLAAFATARADSTADQLRELGNAAGCSQRRSALRAWCPASLGYWKGGTAAAFGRGDKVFLGVTVELEKGKSVAHALSQKVSLSALALRHTGHGVKGRIATLTPSNPKERLVLMKAVVQVAAVLKGSLSTARIDKNLHGYLSTLPKQAKYAVSKTKHGWLMKAASTTELRRVGRFWVAVERVKSGKGIFVSVFTDKHKAL